MCLSNIDDIIGNTRVWIFEYTETCLSFYLKIGKRLRITLNILYEKNWYQIQ